MSNNEINNTWKNEPQVIKQFLEQKEIYEQLCAEVAFILNQKLTAEKIEFSSITYRTKSLESFIEKVRRKEYGDPFKEITDFSGVRVVYLYQSDLNRIQKIIEKEFNVCEMLDKIRENGADKFGYSAVHFLVKISKKYSGTRYDLLKNHICEIQVRTILQDAWALIDHHLVYKKESEIPYKIQRRLNQLAGLFENADNQFDEIRNERENYLKEIKKKITAEQYLKTKLNTDTFREYLKKKFPHKKIELFKGQMQIIYNDIATAEIESLEIIDSAIKKYNRDLPAIKKKLAESSPITHVNEWPSCLEVAYLLAIDHNEFRKNARINIQEKKILESFKK